MSNKEDRITAAQLRAVLPSTVGNREIRALATVGVVVSVRPSWTFIHEGTSEDTCYFVLAGSVLVTRHGETICELGPGSVVGEAAYLDGKLRNASVRAIGAVELFAVPFDRLPEALNAAAGLRRTLSERPTAIPMQKSRQAMPTPSG